MNLNNYAKQFLSGHGNLKQSSIFFDSAKTPELAELARKSLRSMCWRVSMCYYTREREELEDLWMRNGGEEDQKEVCIQSIDNFKTLTRISRKVGRK